MKPPDLPSQLKWKYAHEPARLEWSIKARNYNTFVANNLFIALTIIAIIISYLMYAPEDEIISEIIMQLVCMSLAASMTHQRMNFAYRLTPSGLEYCQWKGFPEWMLTFLKWFAGVAFVICLSLASTDPTFLIGAVAGPGGIGLTYFAIANSKNFREMHTIYHHVHFKWSDFKRIEVDKRRGLINLLFDYLNDYTGKVVEGDCYLFCSKKQRDSVLQVIQQHTESSVETEVKSVTVYH